MTTTLQAIIEGLKEHLKKHYTNWDYRATTVVHNSKIVYSNRKGLLAIDRHVFKIVLDEQILTTQRLVLNGRQAELPNSPRQRAAFRPSKTRLSIDLNDPNSIQTLINYLKTEINDPSPTGG